MLHHNELINIEEDTILGPRSMIRRFTLKNRVNQLTACILTSGGTISSVLLENGKQETIVKPPGSSGTVPVNGKATASSNSTAQRTGNLGGGGGGDSLNGGENGSASSAVSYQCVPTIQAPLSEWQSHVLGLDSLLLTTSPSQSLMYQLTTGNELMITGKLKGHLNTMAPFFFNLVSVINSE